MSQQAGPGAGAGVGAGAGGDPKKDEEVVIPKSDDFFESQTFRLITVVLYLGGVSGLGMTLAIYYLFIWDSSMPPLPEIKHSHHMG